MDAILEPIVAVAVAVVASGDNRRGHNGRQKSYPQPFVCLRTHLLFLPPLRAAFVVFQIFILSRALLKSAKERIFIRQNFPMFLPIHLELSKNGFFTSLGYLRV